MRRRVLVAGVAACGAAALCLQPTQDTDSLQAFRAAVSRPLVSDAHSAAAPVTRIDYLDKVPSRKEQLQKLAEGNEHNPFDILVVGGGATGTGCALDAVTR